MKILVIKPGVLTEENRMDLRTADYIVIETDTPNDIQVINEFGNPSRDLVLVSALEGITASSAPTGGSVWTEFAKAFIKRLMALEMPEFETQKK